MKILKAIFGIVGNVAVCNQGLFAMICIIPVFYQVV